jgi:hypothetical protein
VSSLREKVLGVGHPETLDTCFNLASCLRAEGKTQEAKVFAERSAEGARKVLGPEHPDTKKYEQLVGKRELAESSELIGSRLPGEIESDLQVGYARQHLNGILTMNRTPPPRIAWPFVDSFSSFSLLVIDILLQHRLLIADC